MDYIRNIYNRRLVRVIVLLFCILALVYMVISYMTKGVIEVKTNKEINVVKLFEIKQSGEIKQIKTAEGGMKARVSPGKYRISVENKTQGLREDVGVVSRKTTSRTINLNAVGLAEPVLPSGVFGLVGSSTEIRYLDTASKKLYKISGVGAPELINSIRAFKSIKWADSGYGVGEGIDNRLYAVSGDVISVLAVPFSYSDSGEVRYSVAPNRKVYVSKGNQIYVRDNAGNYKKLYKTQSNKPTLVAGVKQLAVLDMSDEKGVGEDSQGEHILTLVDDTGHSVSEEIGPYEISWSPDGTKLAISGDVTNGIYNNKLQKTGSYPDGNVNGIVWLNNSTILYGKGSSLWSYSLNSGLSGLIANVPFGGSVSSIYPSDDGKIAFISAGRNSKSDKSELKKVYLDGGNSGGKLGVLDVFLPEEIGVCKLSYVNLVKPIITVGYPGGLVSPDACLKSTKGEVKYYGLDPAGFEYVLKPLVEGD